MSNKFFESLCVKSITGNIKEYEKNILEKWLDASEANRKEFEQLQNLFSRIKADEEIPIPNIDVEWKKLNNKIKRDSLVLRNKWSETLPDLLFKPLYKPAIAVLILIILAAIYFLQIENKTVPTISISTKAGEQKTVKLSDGSSVLLNYSSNIQYPKEFSEIREVKLNGEALFSVTKNKKQFKVKTVNAIITVLGTMFTVKTWEAKTDIFVKEGKVNLKQLNSKDNGIRISAGQKSFVQDNMSPSEPEIVDSGESLGWLNNVLTFNHMSLHEIKLELERLYGIPILIQKEEIGKLTLTGSFKVETKIDSVLDMICLALDLKYEKLQNEYTIYKKE